MLLMQAKRLLLQLLLSVFVDM